MNVGVVALIDPNAGFSYITFDKSDVCSNIFNDNPCGYMKNILKVEDDPADQMNFKALNAQLSSLLQDEMMKNQALRDNITYLSEQLAEALEKQK